MLARFPILVTFVILLIPPPVLGQTDTKSKSKQESDLPGSQEMHDPGSWQTPPKEQPQVTRNDPSAFQDRQEAMDAAKQKLAERLTELEEKTSEELQELANNGNGYAQILVADQHYYNKQSGDAVRLYKKAIEILLNQDDSLIATPLLSRLAETVPEMHVELWDQAKLLNQQGGAIKRWLAIYILDALSPEEQARFSPAHVWRANQYLNVTDLRVPRRIKIEHAERQLTFALDADPENVDAKVLLAEKVLIPQRKYRQALELYKELFEEYVGYYVKISELYNALEQPDGAFPYLEVAIERYGELLGDDPENTDYLRRQANAYAMLGEHDTGIDKLLDAIEDATSDENRNQIKVALSRIYLARAMAYASNAENDKASRSKFLQDVILSYQTNPENEQAKTSLSRFGYSNYPETARAREIYDPADDPDNANSESLTVAGTHIYLRGDHDVGKTLVERAIQKNPNNHEALNNLAFMILEEDAERALALSSRAIKINPRPDYYDTRGHAYMKLESWQEALRDLELATRDKAPSADQIRALEQCYVNLGLTPPDKYNK